MGIQTVVASTVFCMNIALSNFVTYQIDRQTRLLTDSAMTENS